MSNTLTKQNLQEVLQDYPTKNDLHETISKAISENNEQQTRNLGAMFEDNMAKLDAILEHIQEVAEVKEDIKTDIKPRLSELERAISV